MFVESFQHFPGVPIDTIEALWTYFSYGLLPGSMLSAALTNNFYAMASRMHPSLPSTFPTHLAGWLLNCAPDGSFGNEANVRTWVGLTDDIRREQMIQCRLRPSVIDILKGTHSAQS